MLVKLSVRIAILFLSSCIAFTSCSTPEAEAQGLAIVCPVINPKPNSDTLTKFIVATHNYNFKQYANTIQIIDAHEPFPPVWFTALPLHAEGFRQIGLPSFRTGALSFLLVQPSANIDTSRSLEDQFDFRFLVLNNKMEVIDTLSSIVLYGGEYSADFRSNEKVEKLWFVRREGNLDLSGITKSDAHKAVPSVYWELLVLDNNDSVKWAWNPIYHLNPELFNFNEKLATLDNKIKWLKLENVEWDNDGNILFCIRNAGGDRGGLSWNAAIGKISRKDGSVIWEKDFFGESINEYKNSLVGFSPYGLEYIDRTDTSTIYSFYEQGFDNNSHARGTVFEYHEKKHELKLLKYIYPETNYWNNGHGGFGYDFATQDYFIEYGLFEKADTATTTFRNAIEYGRGDSAFAVYQLPLENYSFGMQRIKGTVPPRPSIIFKDGKLSVAETADDLVWYQLGGDNKTKVKKVSEQKEIKPQAGVTYCVTMKYGIGYSVSLPYSVSK